MCQNHSDLVRVTSLLIASVIPKEMETYWQHVESIDALQIAVWITTIRILERSVQPSVILAKTLSSICQRFHDEIFPAELRYRRESKALCTIWSLFNIMSTAVWILRNPKCSSTRLLLRSMLPAHNDLFANPGGLLRAGAQRLLQLAAISWLTLQWKAVLAPTQADSEKACVYAWSAQGFSYIGFASMCRKWKPKQSGVLCRWMEHLLYRCRSGLSESKKTRYAYARRIPAGGMHCTVVLYGPADAMLQAETRLIHSLKPKQNAVKAASPPSLPAVLPRRTRGRPPPSKRTRPPLACTVWQGGIPWLRPPAPIPAPRALPLAEPCSSAWRPGSGPPPPGLCGAWWWQCSHRECYAAFQRLRGEEGPLDECDPCLWPVALLAMTWSACVHDSERLTRKWGSDRWAFAFMELVPMITGKVRQGRAIKCLDDYMIASGLLPARGHTCFVPMPCMLAICRKVVAHVLKLHCKNMAQYRWCMSRFRYVVKKPATFLSKCDVSRQSKKVKWKETALCLTSENLNMEGAHFIEKRWDVMMRPDAQEMVHMAWNAISDCIPESMDEDAWAAARQQFDEQWLDNAGYPIRKQQQYWRATDGEYTEHVQHMVPSHGMQIMPDDKRKKSCWLVPQQAFAVSLLVYICNSPYWQVLSIPVRLAEQRILERLRDGIPEALHQRLGLLRKRLTLSHIYTQIKPKCIQSDGSGRTCVREAHSCCRKVQSFARWPHAMMWILCARSVETWCKRYTNTAEIFKMKETATILRRRVAHVAIRWSSSNICKCFRCGMDKPHWAGAVADAGQFFEATSSQSARASIDWLMERLESLDAPRMLTLLRSARRVAWAGGSLTSARRDTVAITTEHATSVFKAAIGVAETRAGDTVVATKGLPIGHCFSKVACSVEMARAETEWQEKEKRWLHECGLPDDMQWTDIVAWARYVDDMICISPVLCEACLLHYLSCMSSVPYDQASGGDKLDWTDVSIILPNSHTEVPYIVPKFKPLETPPVWDANMRAVRAMLIAKCFRLVQLRVDLASIIPAVCDMVRSLKKYGWTDKQLRYLQYSTSGYDCNPPVQALQAALRHERRCLNHRDPPDVRTLRHSQLRVKRPAERAPARTPHGSHL